MKLPKCADNQEQWRLGGHSHAHAICLSMCKYVTQDLGLGVGFSLTSSSPSPSIGMGDCLGAATTEDAAEWVGDGERLLTGSAVAAAAHPPSFLGGCGEEGDELVPPPAGGWGAFRFRCFLSALLEECHQENRNEGCMKFYTWICIKTWEFLEKYAYKSWKLPSKCFGSSACESNNIYTHFFT